MAVTSISRDTGQFTSFDVTARIVTILADAGYAVLRLRTGKIVFAARTQEACRVWLADGDYKADRFSVERGPVTPDDAEELARLQALELQGLTLFGSASWALFRRDWFTEDWARDEAEDLAGINAAERAQWPLSCIDWKLAARRQRDARYQLVAFDGEDYYAQEI